MLRALCTLDVLYSEDASTLRAWAARRMVRSRARPAPSARRDTDTVAVYLERRGSDVKRQSTFTRTRPTLVFALRGHHRNDVRLCDHGARSNLRFRERTAWHFRERSAWHFRQPVESSIRLRIPCSHPVLPTRLASINAVGARTPLPLSERSP